MLKVPLKCRILDAPIIDYTEPAGVLNRRTYDFNIRYKVVIPKSFLASFLGLSKPW